MFHHIADAIRADIDDPLAKWLLVTLCDYANDKALCWPSTFTLSQRTGMSRATVARKLNKLEEEGFITRLDQGKTYYIAHTMRRDKLSQSETPVSQSETPPVSQCDTKLPITNNSKKGVPDGWLPSDELVTSINSEASVEIDHEHEAALFRDYHRSKGNRFADINAAYRNWVRRSLGWRKEKSSRPSTFSPRSASGNTQSDRFGAYLDSIADPKIQQ